MAQLHIPTITLNDDLESIKSGVSNFSSKAHFLKPTKNCTEGLFKYSMSSSHNSVDNFNTSFEEDRQDSDADDPHVPIPDCFAHSTVVSEEHFRQFVKRSKSNFRN